MIELMNTRESDILFFFFFFGSENNFKCVWLILKTVPIATPTR